MSQSALHRIDLSADEVKAGLHGRTILLVDVREPAEFAAERIHGAVNFPLSTFDPAALAALPAADVVLQCGTGKRSGMAADRCREAGLAIRRHLAGGIAAWKAAGFPVISLDAGSGQLRDRGT